MNDTSWRNLSAILGVACVILIIAAGALLATSGESPTPSPSATAAVGSVAPAGTNPTDSIAPSAAVTPSGSAAVPTSPADTSSPGPSGPTPSAPANAPIAAVTFNNLMLDASTDTSGTARTITFITDGNGKVGIAMTKSTSATTRICVKVDDAKPDCRVGTKVNYAGAFTDTAHSVWTITLLGNSTATPTIDLALSWPTNTGKVSLTHGRLQGSSSAGVPEALNGFTATFKGRSPGNVTLSASWTVVTADVDVSLADVDGPKAIAVDEKQFKGAQNLGTAGYSFGIDAAKFYRIFFRSLSADSGRPDLSAVLTIP